MSKKPQNTVRSDFNRIEASALPWWSQILPVASGCVSLVLLPVRLVVLGAEAVVALAFAGLVVLIAAWWLGYVPDSLIAEHMGAVGERLLRIVESSGLI